MSKGVAHTCGPKAGTFKPPTRPSWKRPAGMVLRKAYCSWEQQAKREQERKESWRKHVCVPFLLQQVNNQLVHDFLSKQNKTFSFSFWTYKFICGWPRPVSSRSAKQPGWRSSPIVPLICNKNHSNQAIIFGTLVIIWAIFLVVCRPLPPHWKTSYIFSRWDVVCLYIHWVVQNTKQHPFLSMSVVFTQSASFFFSFITSSIIAKESLSLACPSCLRFALLVINLVAPLTSFLSSSLPLLLPFVYFVTFGSFQPCSRE